MALKKRRYAGDDLDLSRPIYKKGYRQDAESGLYYPEEEMEQAPDGNWYLRGNVDTNLYDEWE